MSAQAQEPGTEVGPVIGSASVLVFDGVATVVASGEFDAGTCQGLADALDVAVGLRLDVVVDVTGVTFMDGAGLRRIESAAAAQVAAGRTLRIANPQRVVVRLLEAAGATELLSS